MDPSFRRPPSLTFTTRIFQNNATNVVPAKAEVVHTAKSMDNQLFSVVECETRYFILGVVEDTWVQKLREPVTLYTSVSPSELLSHLQVLCGGLHDLDVLLLQNEIQHYHQDMEGIHEYINILKNAHRRSKREGNTTTKKTLLLVATNTMLLT